NDVARGALDRARIEAIKASVAEVVDDLIDQDDRTPVSKSTHDAETEAALETTNDPDSDLPVVEKDDLAPEWQTETPVLCIAGPSPLDEAVPIMRAQPLDKHGLPARVEGAEAIASTSIFHLETKGVAAVCLSYLDASSPAHMRYPVRRLRRRLPQARIMLGCWMADGDTLRDTAKPDDVAVTLRDALRLCLDAARKPASPTLTATPTGVVVDAA